MIFNSQLITIIAIIVSLIFAFLFSLLETATVAVSIHKLKSLREKYVWANYAYKLKAQLDRVLIFSLFGNSLFNAIFTTLTSITTSILLTSFVNEKILLPVITIVIAFIIIIFSEALPKIISAKSPIAVLQVIAIPVYYVFLICKPMVWLIDNIVLAITRLLRISASETTSLEEIKAIIADKRLPFQDQHRSILLNSINIERITIKEVLIPLRAIEAIDINGDLDLIYKRIYTTHHTRIIVYENTLDNIIGFIHTKNILSLPQEEFSIEDLREIISQIDFASDFIPIIHQIHHAQKTKSRIFVVINEYGDVSGIACLEDMLEMIFGNFTTDSPQQKHLSIKNDKNQLIVDGSMLIRELNELYNLNISVGINALTINGFVLKNLGGIPTSRVCFKINNLVFEVIQVGNYWVERVKISFI